VNLRRRAPAGRLGVVKMSAFASDVHNDNFCPLVYTLEVEINLLEFNPKYPSNPQTLGDRLRKARMNKGMTLKEVAALFGVTDTTVINWEIRGKIPEADRIEILKEFIGS
jgi:DNA-binding transcriptional regulator YiaG